MTDAPDALQWILEHGSIAGYPLPCRDNPGLAHPLLAHDHAAFVRDQDRFRALGATYLRVSPDVAHMLIQCNEAAHVSAVVLGYDLRCDPSLPPGTVVG